jgi:EpsI family protein
MIGRVALVSICLIATHLYIAGAMRALPEAPRLPLDELPVAVGEWTGRHEPIDPSLIAALQLDDHINRIYRRHSRLPVTLYVGYYGGMQTGNSRGPHAPILCLPGQGWQPIETGTVTIPLAPGVDAGSRSLRVSRFVIDNTSYRFLLLFWYQIHDRAVPTEFASKVYLFAEGLAAKGTDGALIRVAVPLADGASASEAEREGVAFIQAMQPLLARHFAGASQ